MQAWDPRDISDFEKEYKTKHKYISFIKSSVRIIACTLAMLIAGGSVFGALMVIAAGMGIAEIIGIIEEI